MTTETPAALPDLEQYISADEIDELQVLMTEFDDDGLIDLAEFDGFLSALAVGPAPTSLERWWPTIFGVQPSWAAPESLARAHELCERYYAMVQARVSVSPFDLGVAAVPPLLDPLLDLDPQEGADEDVDWDAVDLADDDDLDADEFDDSDLDDDIDDALSDADVDDVEFASDDDDAAEASNDADFDDDEDEIEGEPETGLGETWLSGFRYALSLQAPDWRRVIDEEPELAPWLYQLWAAADGPQPQDDALPAMPPSVAMPEDAGFLALESTLRERGSGGAPVSSDPDELIGLIPVMLHQLWRRHHQGASGVAATIGDEVRQGLANQVAALTGELRDMLAESVVPAGGMNLECLDGYWTAWIASGVDHTPLDHVQQVFGSDIEWESGERARDVLLAMLSYWKAIHTRLELPADPEDARCHPWIEFGDGDPAQRPGLPYGRDFARGFLKAIEDLPRSSRLLLMDPDARHALAPIEALEHGRSTEKRNARMDFEERMSLIAELPLIVEHLGQFWRSSGSGPRAPARATPAPGRNDPCPCGSGKKYKKCHGAPDRLN